MSFQPLLRQHLLPIAGLTAAMALYPRTTAFAEQPVDEPTKQIRARKPIYDAPGPSPRDIHATTPPVPASGITDLPSTPTTEPTSPNNTLTQLFQGSSPTTTTTTTPSSTPTTRLAAQIKRARLGLHTYALATENALNRTLTRALAAETSLTQTVASLAPPKSSNEQLLPGTLYVLVAAMAGSILSRNRNILVRFATPLATGVTAAHYVIPVTTRNVGDLVWRYEERFPVVADNHLRVRESVSRFVETGKAHSQMGLAMAEERVQGVREAVEEWVKKGR